MASTNNRDPTDCFSKMLNGRRPVEAAVRDREFLGGGLSAADADDLIDRQVESPQRATSVPLLPLITTVCAVCRSPAPAMFGEPTCSIPWAPFSKSSSSVAE
jgi:hypothetical protein